jgi:hypothetical protein
LYWVPVESVERLSSRIEDHNLFSKYFYHGVVMDGDWDHDNCKIEDSYLLNFSKQLFIEGRELEETDYYKKVLEGELEPYIRNERHLKLRVNNYIKLFNRIHKCGYQAQPDLAGGNTLDEICISIDRHGATILEDGRHRFMIAKLLNISPIPVIVNRIHSQFWSENKNDWDAHLSIPVTKSE